MDEVTVNLSFELDRDQVAELAGRAERTGVELATLLLAAASEVTITYGADDTDHLSALKANETFLLRSRMDLDAPVSRRDSRRLVGEWSVQQLRAEIDRVQRRLTEVNTPAAKTYLAGYLKILKRSLEQRGG